MSKHLEAMVNVRYCGLVKVVVRYASGIRIDEDYIATVYYIVPGIPNEASSRQSRTKGQFEVLQCGMIDIKGEKTHRQWSWWNPDKL